MRKHTVLLYLFAFVFTITFAQAPSMFNYQAVIRNLDGELIANQNVSLRISIVDDNQTHYSEIHDVLTSSFGMVNLKIGDGTGSIGSLTDVDWGNGSYFIKLEIDPSGARNYELIGISELTSVPYALFAANASTSSDGDSDPSNELQALTLSNDTLYLSESNFVIIPTSATEYWQKNGDMLYLNQGQVGIGVSEYYQDGLSDEMETRFEASYINNEALSYGARYGVLGRVHSSENSLIGEASGGLGFGTNYDQNSFLTGVRGNVKNLSFVNRGHSGQSYYSGGLFSANLDDLTFGSPTGSYIVSGLSALLSGSLLEYPSSGVISAFYSLDEIKTAKTWAGYFDGKVHISDTLALGTTTPERLLDVNGNMRIRPQSSTPDSPKEGDLYAHAATNKLLYYNGTAWDTLNSKPLYPQNTESAIPPDGYYYTGYFSSYKKNTGNYAIISPFLGDRQDIASAIHNDKIYLFGGQTDNPYIHTATDSFQIYDIGTNSWESHDPIPYLLRVGRATTIGDKIYLIGGYNPDGNLDYVYEYDVTLDSWIQKTSMPTPRITNIITYDSKIYCIGGYLSVNLTLMYENEVYDPLTDNWTTLSPSPNIHTKSAIFTHDDKIYLFGGGHSSDTMAYYYLDIYDPLTDQWDETVEIPYPIGSVSSVKYNSKFYFFGGYDINTLYLDRVLEYCPVSDTWREMNSLPVPVYNASAEIYGSKVYLMGGVIGSNDYTNVTVEYDLEAFEEVKLYLHQPKD